MFAELRFLFTFWWKLVKRVYSVFKKVMLFTTAIAAAMVLLLHFGAKDKITIDLQHHDDVSYRTGIYKLLNNPKYNSTDQGKATLMAYRAMLCSFSGEACTNNPADADKNYDRSLIGKMSGLIAMPFAHPPASGVAYTYNALQQAGFVKSTYAYEGVGFAALQPYSSIWKVSRNVAYTVIVLVVVTMGFLIMFRVKISAQTVINIENAIPRIIITLLVITFSFAIAGFLIDLMYLLIVLIVSQMTNLNIEHINPSNRLNLVNQYVGAGFKDLLPGDFKAIDLGSSILNVFPDFVGYLVKWIIGLPVSIFASKGLTAVLGGWIDNFDDVNTPIFGWGKMPGLISFAMFIVILIFTFNIMAPLIVGILIYLTLLFLLFRIFLLLFTTYLQILIQIVAAPLLLLMDIFPGRSSFSGWLKGLIGNLLIFPTIVAASIFGYAVSKITIAPNSTYWQPPFLYNIDPQAFTTLLGVGIVLLIPDWIKIMKKAVGAEDLPINLGLGTFFQGGSSVIGGGAHMLGQYATIAAHVPGITKLTKGIKGMGWLFGGDVHTGGTADHSNPHEGAH